MSLSTKRSLTIFAIGTALCAIAFIPLSVQARADQKAEDERVVVTVAATLPVGDIIVSLKDRRLYHVREKGRAVSYPIATPRNEDLLGRHSEGDNEAGMAVVDSDGIDAQGESPPAELRARQAPAQSDGRARPSTWVAPTTASTARMRRG